LASVEHASESRWPRPERLRRVHIANLVTLSDGTKWMIDVGFGGDGVTKLLPLVPVQITRNIGT